MGNIRPITGREFYEALSVKVEVSHIATIRLDAAVNRTHVITCDSSKYHIQYIIERSNTLLELHITERK
ncbi:phage head closure protein [Priestia megaterium]|uniref:phage head closure protein n=1 Tax=Priestia megaterium TaxID=1404 RepID=UPI0037098494